MQQSIIAFKTELITGPSKKTYAHMLHFQIVHILTWQCLVSINLAEQLSPCVWDCRPWTVPGLSFSESWQTPTSLPTLQRQSMAQWLWHLGGTKQSRSFKKPRPSWSQSQSVMAMLLLMMMLMLMRMLQISTLLAFFPANQFGFSIGTVGSQCVSNKNNETLVTSCMYVKQQFGRTDTDTLWY